MADTYLEQIKSRRTVYSLEASSPTSDDRIIEIAREVILHSPSSFNCQATRMVLLLKTEHIRFWDLAKECFKATMQTDVYEEYEKKLLQRQEAYGTVSEPRQMAHSRHIQGMLTDGRFSSSKISTLSASTKLVFRALLGTSESLLSITMP